MPTPAQEIPVTLRPFHFHGLHTDWRGRDEAIADCPACGRGTGKFSVRVETGEYHCFVCDFSGGHTTFLRWLWAESHKATNREYDAYAKERGLCDPLTMSQWGFCVSLISRAWIVPAYNADGALVQLYKRIKTPERWEFRPTPEVGGHAMHGLPLFDKTSQTIYLCEKPSDAMPLWEALRAAKQTDSGLEVTHNPGASLLSNSSVMAVANCGAVGESLKQYMPLFKGKRVVLCFDHDHSKEFNGQMVEGAGIMATKRAAAMLQGVAAETWWLNWPADRSDKWDIKDELTKE